VVGIDGGTGAAFSIIPPQNATGNWIKIVQRVPVRIDLDPSEIARNPLRIGLSLYTTIDTKEQFGLKVPEAGSDLSVYHTNVYSDQEKGVEEIIRDVIMLNAFFDIHAYPKWDL
jgi:membrane fusion protein (multidrug efflux system)